MDIDDSVKRFIVKSIIMNQKYTIYEHIRTITRILKKSFIIDEKVNYLGSKAVIFEIKNEKYGIRILSVKKFKVTSELVEYEPGVIYVHFHDISRRFKIRKRDVCSYIDSITRHSRHGRIFKSDIFARSHKIGRRITFAQLRDPNNRATGGYGKDIDLSVFKRNKHTLNEIIDLLNCDEIYTGGMIDSLKLFEIFSFCEYFKDRLGFGFTIEELVGCILDKTYSNNKIVMLHMILYNKIRNEFRKANRFINTLFLEGILEICGIVELENERLKQYDNYRWGSLSITSTNWRFKIKKLFSYIYNVLELRAVNSFREFSYTGPKYAVNRVGILKFFIECAFSTDFCRKATNSNLKQRREYVRFRDNLYNGLDNFCYPCGSSPTICVVDNIQFICVGGFIYIIRDSKVYTINRGDVKSIIVCLRPGYKELRGFLIKYYNSYYQTVGDILLNRHSRNKQNTKEGSDHA